MTTRARDVSKAYDPAAWARVLLWADAALLTLAVVLRVYLCRYG